MADDARAQALMGQLVDELKERGLEVAAKLPALTATNPAARVDALSPGLVQQVLLRFLEGRGFTWCWVWPGFRSAERGAPKPAPDIEPMCPADDIVRAADLLANVLRLRDDELDGDRGDV
jgi:hypothetical protein